LEIYKLFFGSALAKSNASNVSEPSPYPHGPMDNLIGCLPVWCH